MASVPLPAGDCWFTELLTPRVRIARLGHDDLDRFVAYRNDPDVAHFQDWPMPYTPALATALIEDMERSAPCVPGEWFQFGLFGRFDGRLVGDVGLHRDADDPHHLRIGFTLARDAWGQGLATEAVAAIIDHAVAITGSTSITADVLAANEPSLRFLQRLGFEEVDRIPRVEEVDGTWHDQITCGMTLPGAEPAIGAVLVGGASSRMGHPKPLVEIAGVSMFEHVVAALATAGLDVAVVGAGPTPHHDHPVIGDPPGLAGPVAGIAAALEHAGNRPVFVVATDQPYVTPPTIRRLLALEGDAVVPIDGDRAQVTCAVYRTPLLDRLEQVFAADTAPSIQVLARTTANLVTADRWQSWGEDGRSWRSLDTPGAVSDALTELGDPAGII